MELFEYEKNNIERVRRTLAECTVLLKKDGHFPLAKPGKIAAFGNGVRHTIKGGTGSGEVNSRYSVNVERGLTEAGFTITTKEWLDAYDTKLVEAKASFRKQVKKEAKEAHQNVMMYAMGKPMPEFDYQIPLKGEGDTAIYILSRVSGEGNDRQFVEGDIKLSATETRDILELNKSYEKFMLVLNVGGVVDLSDVAEVKNILLLSQLGTDTGSALADILLGKNNPSGKLTTTWAKSEEYYRSPDFDDLHETSYLEGIYVGYRYFDTFSKKAIFPFGYGLSFTEFEIKVQDVRAEGEKVDVDVCVKNVGKYSGKEVVQTYLSVPKGLLDHPYQELCGFAKTSEINPGQQDVVTISFMLSDMSSYDEASASYLLEAGDYILRVGNSSLHTQIAAVVNLDEKVVTRKAKNVLGDSGFSDMVGETNKQEEIPADAVRIVVKASDFNTVQTIYDTEYEILPEIEALSNEELCLMNVGGFDPNAKGFASVIGNASLSVCGAAGESTSMVKDIPPLVMADGPAGLRLAKKYFKDEKGLHPVGQPALPESMLEYVNGFIKFMIKVLGGSAKPKHGEEIKSQYCTAIPIGTAVAQSFNEKLAESYGDIVGQEMEMFGVNLWLAPALNIHRSIQCGRNFEYFSEDPLISGKMAAALTRGVQQHKGCGTTIKHYAANNKERNRYANSSRVSERAMREIYTKGFGICVREAHPKAIMTSYNLLNGVHTAEHRGLIEDILRAEYGYDGIVMTDWIIPMMTDTRSKYRTTQPAQVVAAGGDLFMPGSRADVENVEKGLSEGVVTEKQLKINATRVYKMVEELRS